MPIIEIFGKKIAAGVDWSIHEKKRSLRDEAAGRKKDLRLVYEHDNGFLLGLYAGNGEKDVYAGAAALALVEQNAIVCERIGDGGKDGKGPVLYWLCAVIDGSPLPGMDKVVSESAGADQVSTFLTQHTDAKLIGSLAGSVERFEDILNRVRPKQLDTTRLTKPIPVLLPIAAGFAAIAVVVVGVLAWQHFSAERAASRQQAAKSAQELERAAAQARELEKAKADFARQVSEARASLGQRSNNADQVENWLAVLRELPASMSGWLPTSMDCDEKQCKVVWTKGPNALSLGGLEITGGVMVDDNRVEQTWALDPTGKSALRADAFKDENRLRLSLKSIGEIYHWQVDPSAPADVVVNAPERLKGTQPAVVVGRRGAIRFGFGDQVANLIKFQHLGKLLDQSSVSLKKMSVLGLNAGSYSITAEGEYVVFKDAKEK